MRPLYFLECFHDFITTFNEFKILIFTFSALTNFSSIKINAGRENIKNKTLPDGIAVDDGVAVLFIDGKPTEVYSSRKGHNAYFVNQNKQFNLKEYIKINNE